MHCDYGGDREGRKRMFGASMLVMEGVSSPETAEVMAYQEGLVLVTGLAFQKVRIAADCANVVRSI